MTPHATPQSSPCFWLRRETIEAILDARAWKQEALASEIGICRVHLSRLLNGRRPLTRRVRRKFLDCAVLHGIEEGDLWECIGGGNGLNATDPSARVLRGHNPAEGNPAK